MGISSEQEKNVLSKLESLHNAGKITAEIEELMKITPGDLENFNPKKEKLLNSLQHLYDNNKINGEQYDNLKNSLITPIEYIHNNEIKEKNKLLTHDQKLDNNLQGLLSNEDYISISNEIELLNLYVEKNSDKILEQEKKVLDKIQNLYDSNKFTDSEYEDLKKSVNRSISLAKKQQQEMKKVDGITEFNKELSSILTGDDYTIINKEMQA